MGSSISESDATDGGGGGGGDGGGSGDSSRDTPGSHYLQWAVFGMVVVGDGGSFGGGGPQLNP